jgi:hypothetical protein
MERKQRQQLGCVGAVLIGVLLSTLMCWATRPTIEPPRPQEPPTITAPSTPKPEAPAQGWSKQLRDHMPGIKVSYDVTLERKMTKAELEAIAMTLQDKSVERNFVAFSLKGREDIGVSWASAQDKPTPEVRINGVPKDHKWAKSKLKGERKGPWVNESSRYLVSIVKTPKGLVLEEMFMSGEAMTDRLKLKGERYIVTKEPEVYYVINGANLEAWTTNEGPRRFDVYYPPD